MMLLFGSLRRIDRSPSSRHGIPYELLMGILQYVINVDYTWYGLFGIKVLNTKIKIPMSQEEIILKSRLVTRHFCVYCQVIAQIDFIRFYIYQLIC